MSCKCKKCGYEAERKPKTCPKCGSQIWMEMSSKINKIYRSQDREGRNKP